MQKRVNLMNNIKFPVTQLENSTFQVCVDLSLYAKEAVVSAIYKYTDRFYIHQQTKEGDLMPSALVGLISSATAIIPITVFGRLKRMKAVFRWRFA